VVSATNYKAPYHAIFSSIFSTSSRSHANIVLNTPSRTPPTDGLPTVSDTKFYALQNNRQDYSAVYFNSPVLKKKKGDNSIAQCKYVARHIVWTAVLGLSGNTRFSLSKQQWHFYFHKTSTFCVSMSAHLFSSFSSVFDPFELPNLTHISSSDTAAVIDFFPHHKKSNTRWQSNSGSTIKWPSSINWLTLLYFHLSREIFHSSVAGFLCVWSGVKWGRKGRAREIGVCTILN
jgi:hypothetical protein